MKFTIDRKSDTPAYLQLYKQLRDDIASGAYTYGVRLPSKRMIAEETGISVITVEHALALLCDEGYVESRERSGYFVVFRTDDGFAVSPGKALVHRIPAAKKKRNCSRVPVHHTCKNHASCNE